VGKRLKFITEICAFWCILGRTTIARKSMF